jgi:hypothetical protein
VGLSRLPGDRQPEPAAAGGPGAGPALGYRTGDQPRGIRPGDGQVTAGLVAAVKKWQQDIGVAVTGAITPAPGLTTPAWRDVLSGPRPSFHHGA